MVGLTACSESQMTPTRGSLWWGKTPRFSFSGNRTFPFRYAWLPKGIAAVQADPFGRGPRLSLPDDILALALADFWHHNSPGGGVLALERVLFDPGSPGAAFKLRRPGPDRDSGALARPLGLSLRRHRRATHGIPERGVQSAGSALGILRTQ